MSDIEGNLEDNLGCVHSKTSDTKFLISAYCIKLLPMSKINQPSKMCYLETSNNNFRIIKLGPNVFTEYNCDHFKGEVTVEFSSKKITKKIVYRELGTCNVGLKNERGSEDLEEEFEDLCDSGEIRGIDLQDIDNSKVEDEDWNNCIKHVDMDDIRHVVVHEDCYFEYASERISPTRYHGGIPVPWGLT